MTTPLEVTEAIFTSFGNHDIDAIVERLHADIKIEFYGPSTIPYANIYQGRVEARRFFEIVLSSVDIHQFDAEQFICQEDMVVVVGHLNLTARSTGRVIDSDFVHVITVEDGKWISFRDFMNTATAVEAFSK